MRPTIVALTLILTLATWPGASRAELAFIEDFEDGELLENPTWVPDPSPECGPDPWVYWEVIDGRLHADGCPLDRPHRGALTTHDHGCRVTAGSWELVGQIEQQGELQVFFANGAGGADWAIWIADNPSPASFPWVNHRAICLKNTRAGWTDVICTPWIPEVGRDYDVRASRTADGTWSLFVDDELIGAAFDPDFPDDQREIVINQDLTPVQVDYLRIVDETGACAPPVLAALAHLDPPFLDTETDDGEAEEPEDATLSALLELPAGIAAVDLDVLSVTLHDEAGPLATALSAEPDGSRVWLGFGLDLEIASRLSGAEALAVEVDEDNHELSVHVVAPPAEPVDVRDLTVTGRLVDGTPFEAPCTMVVRRTP